MFHNEEIRMIHCESVKIALLKIPDLVLAEGDRL